MKAAFRGGFSTPRRRVPGTQPQDYLSVLPLLWSASGKTTVADVMNCNTALYTRLWQPVLLAALNTDPKEASAAPCRRDHARDVVRGRPRLPSADRTRGLEHRVRRSGAGLFASARRNDPFRTSAARACRSRARRVAALDFGDDIVKLGSDGAVILAVPPPVAASLLPDLKRPTEFRAIVNAHFRVAPPAGCPPITGVINGLVEWLFAFPDRLSVTISGADRLARNAP